MLSPSLPPKYNLAMRRGEPVAPVAPIVNTATEPIGALKPDIGSTFGLGRNEGDMPDPSTTIGGLNAEEVAGMKDTSLADIGNFISENKGRIAGYGLSLATLGPVATLGLGKSDAIITGAKELGKYLYGKAKNALGFGVDKSAPASGLPRHGPEPALNVPSYNTMGYGSTDVAASTVGATHGPPEGINPSESFNTRGSDIDGGWFSGGGGGSAGGADGPADNDSQGGNDPGGAGAPGDSSDGNEGGGGVW